MSDWRWDPKAEDWSRFDPGAQLTLVVAGTPAGPHPLLVDRVRQWLAALPELAEQIADYLVYHTVYLETDGGPVAITHPRRPQIYFEQIEARDPNWPSTGHLFVTSDYLDPYIFLDVTVTRAAVARVVGGYW